MNESNNITFEDAKKYIEKKYENNKEKEIYKIAEDDEYWGFYIRRIDGRDKEFIGIIPGWYINKKTGKTYPMNSPEAEIVGIRGLKETFKVNSRILYSKYSCTFEEAKKIAESEASKYDKILGKIAENDEYWYFEAVSINGEKSYDLGLGSLYIRKIDGSVFPVCIIERNGYLPLDIQWNLNNPFKNIYDGSK